MHPTPPSPWGEMSLPNYPLFFPHKTFFLLDHALPPEGSCVVQKRGDTQELLDGLHRGCWVDTKFLPIHNQQLKGQGCGSLQIPKTGLKGGDPNEGSWGTLPVQRGSKSASAAGG